MYWTLKLTLNLAEVTPYLIGVISMSFLWLFWQFRYNSFHHGTQAIRLMLLYQCITLLLSHGYLHLNKEMIMYFRKCSGVIDVLPCFYPSKETNHITLYKGGYCAPIQHWNLVAGSRRIIKGNQKNIRAVFDFHPREMLEITEFWPFQVANTSLGFSYKAHTVTH